MEGQQFLTINPDTLVDRNLWSYRDLQKISKSVGIRANSKREKLIRKLQEWHRDRKDGTQTLVGNDDDSDDSMENYDMNVIGNNFAILPVNVREKKAGTKRKRNSILGLDDEKDGIVSPKLLLPLRPEPATPGKGILKTNNGNDENRKHCASPPTASKMANICFSPFNAVKVIAHREETPSAYF
jgi:hypothetical protein